MKMPSVRNLKSKFEQGSDEKIVSTIATPPKQNTNFLTVPDNRLVKEPIENDLMDRTDSDLGKLKAMAERLNLSTRRPSYVEWKEKYIQRPDIVKSLQRGSLIPANSDNKPLPWTPEREDEISSAIGWIRNQLMEMRSTDQELARTLVALRHDIHTLKLEFSCQAHRMVIEEVEEDLEEEDILNELSDCPMSIGALSPLAPLQKFGVTRMNIERRRFSLC